MRRWLHLILAVAVVVGLTCGQSEAADPPTTAGTAHTLRTGKATVGVFQPLRYGVSQSLEVATHPAANVLIPNVSLKRGWPGAWGFAFASEHSLSFPTGLLKALAREGAGGVLPAATHVPHVVGVCNGVLASRPLGSWHWVTLKAELALAARFGKSTLSTVDLPLAFPRLAAYHKGWSTRAAIDLDGMFTQSLGYGFDVDAFVLPYRGARYALEHSGVLLWKASDTLTVFAGYKVVYGAYPFGRSEWNLGDSWVPFPLLDIMWHTAPSATSG